jgi:signal peptidase I
VGSPVRQLVPFGLRRFVAGAAVLCTAALGGGAVLQGSHVEGISMLPSLQPGQLLLVNRTAFWFGGPHRGDLVVFRAPTGPGRDFVKRVIGLPGDSLLIDSGRVEINGQALDEPYVHFPADYTYPLDSQPLEVPEDAYFVLGDNRPESADSHLGWVVPSRNLVGRPLALGASESSVQAATPQVRPAAPIRIGMLPGQSWLDLGQATTQWLHGRIATDDVGWFVARPAPLPVPIRDAVVSATFRKIGGAPGGSTGLIVRSSGAADYYTFELHDDGKIAVWRRRGDSWFELLPATETDALRPAASPNQLLARVVGDQLDLQVNGVQVAQLTDPALPQGGAGVFVQGQGNAVDFQDFLVQPL